MKKCFLKKNPVTAAVLLAQGLVLAAGTAVAEEVVLDEVKVTATADVQEERRISSAGKIIVDRQELEKLNSSSVGELLGKLPGTGMFVDPDSAGMGGGPRRGPRGPNRNMPQILVDGQPLPGGDRNPGAVMRLPVELIERVEIIRNSTPEFQVTSPAGVINLVMRDVPSTAMKNVKLALGLLGDEWLGRVDGQYSDASGNVSWLLSGGLGVRPETGNRETVSREYSGGVLQGTVVEQLSRSGDDTNFSFSPKVTMKLEGGHQITVSPFVSATRNDRTGLVLKDDNGTLSSDRDEEEGERLTSRLLTEWKLPSKPGQELTLRAIVQGESEDSEKTTYRFDSNQSLLGTEQDETDRRESEQVLEARGKYLAGETHLLGGGLEWRNKHSDESRLTGSTLTETDIAEQRLALWLQDEWQISEQHLLTPGFRLQKLQTEVDSTSGDVDRDVDVFSPSLHYLWQPSQSWNVRGSIAATTRAPFTRDLSPLVRLANGVNTSSNPDRAGNPDLKEEDIRSIEAGVEHFLADRAGTIGFSVYERFVDNYTQRLTLEESGRWVERPYNVGSSTLTGAVVDFKSRLDALQLKGLTVRGNLSYADSSISDPVAGLGSGEGPRRSMNVGADYEVPERKLTFGGTFTYTAQMDRESSETVVQDIGEQMNLDLYALYKMNRNVYWRLSAQNVTRYDRKDRVREYDESSGELIRTEDETVEGLMSVQLSLEMRL